MGLYTYYGLCFSTGRKKLIRNGHSGVGQYIVNLRQKTPEREVSPFVRPFCTDDLDRVTRRPGTLDWSRYSISDASPAMRAT